jgi:group I intron endonuclease
LGRFTLMNNSGIYKIYWENNPYFYYGQAVNLNRRKLTHINSLKKGIHKNPKMQSIYNKYGDFIFEPVVYCDLEQLNSTEQEYLDCFFNNKNCCNICPIAGSSKGRKITGKALLAIQEAAKNRKKLTGANNPFFGKKHTEETKYKISQSRIGRKFPKISEAKRGFKATEETKQKLSQLRKYGGAPKAKIIIDTNTGVFYSCAKEVSDLYNFVASTFRSKMNGRLKNNTQFKQI